MIEQLVDGTGTDHYHMGKMVGVNWRYPDFIAGIASIDYASLLEKYDLNDIPLIKYDILNIAEELARNVKGMSPLIDKQNNLHIIFNFRQTISRKNFNEYNHYLKKLQKLVKQFWKIDMNFFYSETVVQLNDLGQEILTLYQEKFQHFYAKTSINSLNKHSETTWNYHSHQLLNPFGDHIAEAFEDKDQQKIIHYLQKLEELSKNENIDPKQLIQYSVQWIHSLEIKVADSLDSPDSADHHDYIYYFQQATKLRETMKLFKRKIISLMNQYEKRGDTNENPRLQKINQYILDHLSESISTTDMANYLYFNPSYFSRYFKKIAGKNFTDYVHEFKMNIAQKMLRESEESTKKSPPN